MRKRKKKPTLHSLCLFIFSLWLVLFPEGCACNMTTGVEENTAPQQQRAYCANDVQYESTGQHSARR